MKLFVDADASSSTPGFPTQPWAQVMTAAVNGFNARHTSVKIQATFCDSKGTGTAALGCAREATKGHYDAAVLGQSFNDFLISQPISESHVPILAAAVDDPKTWNNKLVYCMSATLPGELAGLGSVAKGIGATRVASVQAAGPTQTLASTLISSFSSVGIKYVGTVTVPASTTDWTPGVTEAMGYKPNALVLGATPGPQADAVFEAAKQVDPSIKFVEPGFDINAQLAAAPVLEGAAVSSWAQPPLTQGVEGTTLFRADVTKWGNASADESEPYMLMWLAIQMAGNVAPSIKGPVTPAGMITALNSAKNLDEYGIIPPYSGSARGTGSQACVWNHSVVRSEIKNHKLIADVPGQFVSLTTHKTFMEPTK